MQGQNPPRSPAPVPDPAPANPGGYQGIPRPEFKPGTELAIRWWDGQGYRLDLVEVRDDDDPRLLLEIPWARIVSWTIVL